LARPTSSRLRLREVEAQVRWVTGDITDAAAVREAVERANPEVVYHLASTSFNPPTTSAATHFGVIVMGTLHLLEALVGRPDVRVIATGSVFEYGSGSHLREDQPPMPNTVLGAAKAGATLALQAYAKVHGVHTVILRVFTPYGPWERPGRLIPLTILSALKGEEIRMSSGRQQRDYFYIDDLVEALCLAAVKSVPPGTVMNVCSGRGVPVREIVELTLKLMGDPVKAQVGVLQHRPDEVWESSGDNTAARKLLGWEPRVSLEEGLRKTIAWFTEHRELAHQLP
jgi:nucleoside-diphosphate-sugar epimerase